MLDVIFTLGVLWLLVHFGGVLGFILWLIFISEAVNAR
jgi:hypothetical protein